jgi:nucleoside recognition membrane protein YjiH
MNVILTFYRNFIWPATFITLISCYILLDSSPKDVVYLFWMKIITGFFIATCFEFVHAQQFYFFNNLGYSKTKLYLAAAIVDLSVWLLLTLTILLI